MSSFSAECKRKKAGELGLLFADSHSEGINRIVNVGEGNGGVLGKKVSIIRIIYLLSKV